MLGLTAAASATDAAINQKILGSGNHTTLIISNDDMQDLLKIVKSLEDSGILLNRITETVRNKVKERKGSFLSMLLVTLGASLLSDLSEVLQELEKEQLELVMDLKTFDSPTTDKP